MANPFENAAGPQVGLAVVGVPVYEDDPKHPGRKRVKRTEGDRGEIVYTPDSVAAFKRYKAEEETKTAALGPAVTENPVLAFYRQELAYQRDPSKTRPRAGAHSVKVEIPKELLKALEKEAVEKKR